MVLSDWIILSLAFIACGIFVWIAHEFNKDI